MGFFSDLYKFVTGKGNGAPPQKHHQLPTKQERIRQTAADEHQARKKQAEPADSMASLKAKIAAESAKILRDLKKPFAAEIEKQHAESLQRQAEIEARIERDKPENRFLAGDLKLTLNIHFRSSNPDKPAVYQVWYIAAEQSIYVTFYEGGPGRTYRYWTIDRQEALTMYRASSKGIHVWDAFRVRGSKTAHKKSYAQV